MCVQVPVNIFNDNILIEQNPSRTILTVSAKVVNKCL